MELSSEERRERFGPGPWLEEPDDIEWRHEGVVCTMSRHPALGAWRGYVDVEPGHPWHGKSYDNLRDVEAHGGLTYTGDAPGGAWRVGFDCGHWGDLQPGLVRTFPVGGGGTYRDRHYVSAEVERLASQARAAAAHMSV